MKYPWAKGTVTRKKATRCLRIDDAYHDMISEMSEKFLLSKKEIVQAAIHDKYQLVKGSQK